MKLLNFRHFNTSSKKYLWNSNFFPEISKNGSKKATIILFSIKELLVILQQFIISDVRRLPKIPEDRRMFPKTNEEVRPLPKMSEEPAKHLTVFSSETVNIKKNCRLNSNWH